MKTLKFKTNLKCPHCIEKVSAPLDQAEEIRSWSVDLDDPDKTLTVETENEETLALVCKILSQSGYCAEISQEQNKDDN